MRTSAFLLIVASVTAVSIFAIGMLIDVASTVPPRTVQLRATEGEVYFDNCASCHARNGSGQTAEGFRMRIPDLRNTDFENKTADQLIEDIARTEPHRTLNRDLGRTEMLEAIEFVRRLQ